ncbi:MAG TPA: hypothetical protein DEP45_02100 [Armatimonadetes bacterium]|nr:hypothetical protein [Armatimonadota bacterium]
MRRMLTISVLVALLIAGIGEALAQPRSAPLNPGFRTALQRAQVTGNRADAQGHTLGFIPPPFKRSPAGASISARGIVGAPASYDSRTTPGKVPPVRNQGDCGSCWAFATYGSLETYLRPGDTSDFSENHLRNNHLFDYAPCAGGNEWMSAAYLGRWAGPVLESEDPYNPTGPSPAGLGAARRVQEVLFLPADAATIKNAVMAYGAVYVAYESDGAYYYAGPAGMTYYYRTARTPNHAVCIIGWDDNFASTNFKLGIRPSGNGAWLVRNSWGATWGDDGYFWGSYYDGLLGKTDIAAFVSAEAITNYDNNHGYDDLGDITALNSPYAANVFTSTKNETLRAVGIYTESAGASYTVRVYRNPSPLPAGGTSVATVSGSATYAGYHTVALDTPVSLAAGDVFTVSVQSTDTSGYPSAVEFAYAGYSSKATASPGQSYYSFDGTSWGDLTAWDNTANFCIKAFTDNVPPTVTAIDPASGYNTAPLDVVITGTGFQSGASVVLRKLDEDDITGTSVDVNSATEIECTFNLTGAAVGLWDVVVTNPDGESGALEDGFEVVAGDTSPPDIAQWSVALTHSGVGELITPIADGFVEPRTLGVRCFIVAFDEPLDAATFTNSCVTITGVTNGNQSGLLSSVALQGDGSIARITLSGALPQPDRYTVSISDAVKDLYGNALGGDRDIAIGALQGDANANATVDIGDMLAVRANFSVAVTGASCRYDVNCNGIIDVGDQLAVRATYGARLP